MLTDIHSGATPVVSTETPRPPQEAAQPETQQGAQPAPAMPDGTVTFLFTDIEGSTRLWEAHPHAMRSALARHDALLRALIAQHGGSVFKTVGDAFCASFRTTPDAVGAAVATQRALNAETWPDPITLRVRMAVHVGEAEVRDNDYFGQPLNHVARLLGVGHGGQVLLSAVAQALSRDNLPPNCSLQNLGEHRLRDMRQAETIFQLVDAAQPSLFPPLKTQRSAASSSNLPMPVTAFIGREKELAQAQHLLSLNRLLTLTGTGGCGKTRLAIQIGHELLDGYPGGVWLVELAALLDSALVVHTVARVLEAKEQPGIAITETLIDRVKDQRMLVILDNCEHMVGACAQLAALLLRSCPQLTILATSREALAIAGEQTYRVPSLTVPEGRTVVPIDTLKQYSAIQMFVERARLISSDFAVTAENASDLMQICQRLDGIPLAIELAVARLRSLSLGDLNRRLNERFDLLTGGDRTALPRQQTLRALIDWSYVLLTHPEQTLLRRISVFVGGCRLPAAEAVCAEYETDGSLHPDDILDVLASLIDKNLVAFAPHSDGSRYKMLEMVRRYSREKLDAAGESDTVTTRHRRYFLDLAESAVPHLTTDGQAMWLATLEADHDNFRAALSTSPDAETTLQLAGALWRFWMMRGHLAEGRKRLEAALNTGPGVTDEVRSRALTGLGMLMLQQLETAAAVSVLEESLALRRATGAAAEVAETVNILGIAARSCGDLDRARCCYEESMNLRHQLGDAWGVAAAGNNLGMVAVDQEDFAAARDYFARSLLLYRQLGDAGRIASVSNNLGYLALKQRDCAAARAYFAEALEQFRALDDPWNIMRALHNLGAAHNEDNLYTDAIPLFVQSLEAAVELNSGNFLYYPLKGLTDATNSLGRNAIAAQLIGTIDAICGKEDIRLSTTEAADLAATVDSIRGALGDELFRSARAFGFDLPASAIPALIGPEFGVDVAAI